jgi:hypothetical protein
VKRLNAGKRSMARFPKSERPFWQRSKPQTEEQPHDSFIAGDSWEGIAQMVRASQHGLHGAWTEVTMDASELPGETSYSDDS